MIFVGVDWAEVHHNVSILDEGGDVLARKRIPDAFDGAVNTAHGLRISVRPGYKHLEQLRRCPGVSIQCEARAVAPNVADDASGIP
jgi:hypothetical protein